MLWALCERTNNANGTCYPSYQRIADDAGIHRTTAIALVKQLIALGVVTVIDKHGETNLYQVSLGRMQELSPATGGLVGVVGNGYSGSSVLLPGELPTATSLVAGGYSNSLLNSSGNSSGNEVSEEGVPQSQACSTYIGGVVPVTNNTTPPNAAAPPSPEAKAAPEPHQKLTGLLLRCLGEPPELLTPALSAQMQAKAKVALATYTYDELEPVIRWVLSPESDEPTFKWRAVIAGATNPMAMVAKHVNKIVEKFGAYQRKQRMSSQRVTTPANNKKLPEMGDNLMSLWGDVRTF